MNTIDWTKPIQVRMQAYADDLETRKDRIYPARLLGKYGGPKDPYYVVAYRQPGTEPFDKSEILHTSGASGQIQRGLWVENVPKYTYSGVWFSPFYAAGFMYGSRCDSLNEAKKIAASWVNPALFYVVWNEDGFPHEIILAADA